MDAAEKVCDLDIAGLEAELLRRLVFQVVRFIDDEVTVLGQDVAVDGDVG